MRNGTRIALAAAALVALAVPLAALALARGDAAGASTSREAELREGRRAGRRREVRRLPSTRRHRAVLTRYRAADLVELGRYRGSRAGEPHAAVASGEALAGIRGAEQQDPERAAARVDPRVGACRREDRRPRSQADGTERPGGASGRGPPRPEDAGTYTPSAPKGITDDYRCFLLDPKQAGDSFVTSARIVPGQPKIVHHVILFQVGAAQIADAKRLDGSDAGPGWSCFGGTGLPAGDGAGIADSLNNANWVAAWAPGWGGNRLPEGTGVTLPAGSKIVMQVHYNLLNGRAPDRSRALLTVAPASAKLTPLQTVLLPAPVELACAKGEQGKLCDRNDALFDLARKYGTSAAFTPAGLLILCRGNAANPAASAVSTCDRRITTPTTIYVAAGHMHLLGASIKLELNPGTPQAKVLLDIPRWDFHWQNAYTLADPVKAQPGDVVRVTCRHDVRKRDARRPRRAEDAALHPLGRGHDGRDVPRDPAGHARVARATTRAHASAQDIHR